MPPLPPRIRDWEHFRSIRFDHGLWAPLAREVLARHGLAGDGPVELASSVHVVAVTADVVVKLYQPFSDGASGDGTGSFETETAALRLLGGAGLPVPRLLASGQLGGAELGGAGWPWPCGTPGPGPGTLARRTGGAALGITAVPLGATDT